ncbi:UNVERIFIED_CONTAM: Transcription elongation factor SPT4 [Siphonaria sp. JEL0065]|nr:Transcription elongation factor SPT4 [Siphonaria sp. JEL0065]
MADILPTEINRNKWRACLLCGLIKTSAQFKHDGCNNCEDVLELTGSNKRVSECTSAQFDGVIGLTQPDASWVARWQRCDKFTKGLYAIRVSGRLPDDLVEDMKDRGFNYRPRDGSVKD